MPATGAERVARHRRRQQEHTAELERQVEDLQSTVARLEAEHSECLPLLARADDLRRRAAEIEAAAA